MDIYKVISIVIGIVSSILTVVKVKPYEVFENWSLSGPYKLERLILKKGSLRDTVDKSNSDELLALAFVEINKKIIHS